MQTTYNGLELPKNGQPIDYQDGQFEVPDHPIIPFIEGDGTGRDIWKASRARLRRRGGKGLRRQARHPLV